MKSVHAFTRLAALAALPLLAGQAGAQGYGYAVGDGFGYGATHSATPCQTVQRDRQLTGALVGGMLGGVAGGLIADTGDDDDDHAYVYRHRGWHGYRRGWHGVRGFRVYDDYDDDDGDIVAGVLLGALAGGLAGSALAGGSDPCPAPWPYADVPPPTRSATGPAWRGPPHAGAASHGVVEPTWRDRDWPDQAWTGEDWNGLPEPPGEPLAGGPDGAPAPLRECREVVRETRLPDGRMIEDTVLACREGELRQTSRPVYGDWELADGS